MALKSAPATRLQLKVTLRNVEPAVWRRIEVAGDLTFAKLHDAIQRAFGWEVEKVLEPDPAAPRAVLAAGDRACPLEDCGGPPGHFDLVAALRDPAHPEHAEMREWAGDYDPARFDLAKAARAVARSTGPKRRR